MTLCSVCDKGKSPLPGGKSPGQEDELPPSGAKATGLSNERLKMKLEEQRNARRKAENNLSASRQHIVATTCNLQDTEMALADAVRARDQARRELGAALDCMGQESRAREELEELLLATQAEVMRLRELSMPLTSLQFVRREYYSAERDARVAADNAAGAMQKEKEAAQVALREMLNEVGDMRSALSAVKGLLAEKTKELEAREGELKAAGAQIEKLKGENGNLHTNVKSQASEILKARGEKRGAEDELKAVKRELGTQRHGREGAEAALQDLMKEMAEIKSQLKESTERGSAETAAKDAALITLEEARVALADKATALEAKVAEAEGLSRDLDAERMASETLRAKLQEALAGAGHQQEGREQSEAAVKALAAELAETKSAEAVAKNDLHKAGEDLKQALATLAASQSDVKSGELAQADLQKKWEEAMASLEETEAALREATAGAGKLRDDLVECSAKKLAAESSATLLVDKCAKSEAEITSLKTELAELKVDVQNSAAEKSAILQSMESKKSQLAVQSGAAEVMKREMKELSVELSSQVSVSKALQNEVENLKESLAEEKRGRHAAEEATRVLVAECSAIKAELTSTDQARGEALRVSAATQSDLADLKTKFETELAEKDLALQNLSKTQVSLDETLELLANAREEQARLASEVEAAEVKLTTRQRAMEASDAALRKFMQDLGDTEKAVADLSETVKRLQGELEENGTARQSLQAELDVALQDLAAFRTLTSQEAAGREAAETELTAIREKYSDELQLRKLAESGRQDIREELEREKVARAAAEKALDTAMGKLAKEQHLNDVVQTAIHYIADRTPGIAEPQPADTSQIHEAVLMSPRPASPGRRIRSPGHLPSPGRPSYLETPVGAHRSALHEILSSAHVSPSMVRGNAPQRLSQEHLIQQTTIMPSHGS